MARTRRNPRAAPTPKEAVVVRVGPHGKLTHYFDEEAGDVICKSGKNAGRHAADGSRNSSGERTFHQAFARGDQTGKIDRSRPAGVTCYRCAKLAAYNAAQGRLPWEGPSDAA